MQENIDYETSVTRLLQQHELVPNGYMPTRTGQNPDILIQFNNQIVGCELKQSLDPIEADLEYHSGNRAMPWQFAYISTNDLDRTFLKQFITTQNVLSKLKGVWNQAPLNLTNQRAEWNQTIGRIPMSERYERDAQTFQDVEGAIPASALETFYNSRKHTYYINVAKYGLYTLGTYNPLSVNVPRFAEFVKCFYYAKMEGTPRNYRFVLGMTFQIQGQSPTNLDPTHLNLSGFGIT
jgi:hypothetical protein